MKAQTLLQGSNGVKKLNDGNLVIAIQCNRVERGNGQYQLGVNMDWSFDDATTAEEIKSFIGGFLGNVEDIFGAKMVTEAVMHYAQDQGHIIDTPKGKILHLKSQGIDFKKWKI